MRPRILVLALAAGSFALPANPAHAAVNCAAVAVPAHYNPFTFTIEGQGEFACREPAAGMTVTVCLEEQLGGVLGGSWYTDACQTVTSQESTQQIGAKVSTRVPIYGTFFRTVVTGSNANGDTASDKSAPTPWVNCACTP